MRALSMSAILRLAISETRWPQPSAMLRAARYQVRRVREEQRNLLRAEHTRQPLGRGDPGHAVAEPWSAERDVEEEPQRRAGQVHAGIARAAGGEVELVAPQVLPARPDPVIVRGRR